MAKTTDAAANGEALVVEQGNETSILDRYS